jgi:hypothetical protein
VIVILRAYWAAAIFNGFEVREAKVQSLPKVFRTISFVLGSVLFGAAIWLYLNPPPEAKSPSTSLGVAAATSVTVAPTTAPPLTTAPPPPPTLVSKVLTYFALKISSG